ncbi:MAG: glycerophosphodiester phosphodiesterase family protein [Candidatus Tectimicrobiota bacterium]
MLSTFCKVRYRQLPGWGRVLVWSSFSCLSVLGLLGAAYGTLGVYVVVSCGPLAQLQREAALAPGRGSAPPLQLRPALPSAAPWPLIIGHSGSTYWCQRNTLGCLSRSLALGATMLEVDVRLSADGHLVAFHDAEVDQQTNGSGAVQHMTRAQLLALHLKRVVTPSAVEADEPPQDQRIALLDEIRQAFPETPLLLDIKTHEPPMDTALMAFVQRFEGADFSRIYIKTRSQQLANRLRRLPQPPKTGLTLCERVAFVAFPGLVTSPPGLLDLPLWLVSPALLQRATAAGHLVVVSLVNETQDWRKVLTLPGVFGVVTDRPEAAFPQQP